VNVLVCVKRVPETGGRVTLSPDAREIDTRYLGFTVSPHEECATEEAVRLVEAHGGSSTVLSLGPEAASEQLRAAMAIGIDRAILLETDGQDWDPVATAAAIVDAIRAEAAAGVDYDLLLFGNEAADSGDFQVGIRVALALGLPCANGVKSLEVKDGIATARREAGGGWEVFEVPLPAVVAVREGINLPRYPSVPGRLRAKKKEIERSVPLARPARATGPAAGPPAGPAAGPEKIRLRLPAETEGRVEILGTGAEAAPAVVDLLERIGVLAR
jgi:electron transfer flavoprotein beta subunit